MNSRNARIAAEVNAWFYTKADDYSPAHTVCDIAGLFAEFIEKKRLRLCMPYKDFRERICEATCIIFKADLESSDIRGPIKIPNPPKNWDRDIEIIWDDYIHSFILTDEFWHAFWHNVYTSVWESMFPNYRLYIQTILPFYIQRDYTLLEDNNLIMQKDDGTYVDVNDYDSEDDYKSD